MNIWGNDYDTPDGTGVRDCIHVVGLALGRIKALENKTEPQCRAINLGTGKGLSVLEIIDAFERACGKKINYQFAPRRSGDVASCFADTTLAEKLLNWRAERNVADMNRNACRWRLDNLDGYAQA